MTYKLHEGDCLWTPTPEAIAASNLERYRQWVNARYALTLADYPALWRWSVDHLETFWESLFTYFDLRYSHAWTTPLQERIMPGAVWFPEARLNYAENILAKATPERPALLYTDESLDLHTLSWADLTAQVQRAAQVLRRLGLQKGDRIAAYLPNIPEAVIALLATASLGAIWSSCPPDFGKQGVLDRFQQIEPKVFITVTGYAYNGKWYDRHEVVTELLEGLPTVQHTLVINAANQPLPFASAAHWDAALQAETLTHPPHFEQVPFDHPLWILYSSGTTGLPKPIVQGHGGILLEHSKETIFHNDLKAGDRFFWYSSTGWMMWNYLVGSLLSGATIILYNGSPTHHNLHILFELAEKTQTSYFGISAAFVHACLKADIRPNQQFDLSHINAVGCTGSPLSVAGFAWIYQNINPTLALEALSGGTDLCTPFIGGVRTQPIYAGEMQGASLGASVQAFDEHGQPLTDAVGELVITQPMPSMPLGFWGDANGSRYRASYFEVYPNVWRHGDWLKINARSGCIIYGRSDSTINRHGVRMGTAELYPIIEAFPAVLDSLIIDLELLGRESQLLLFVTLREGFTLSDALKEQIKTQLRVNVSPRHCPDAIIAVDAVPYTLSGKKMEVPVRKILLGMNAEQSAKREAMRNPEALDFFIHYAAQLRS